MRTDHDNGNSLNVTLETFKTFIKIKDHIYQ